MIINLNPYWKNVCCLFCFLWQGPIYTWTQKTFRVYFDVFQCLRRRCGALWQIQVEVIEPSKFDVHEGFLFLCAWEVVDKKAASEHDGEYVGECKRCINYLSCILIRTLVEASHTYELYVSHALFTLLIWKFEMFIYFHLYIKFLLLWGNSNGNWLCMYKLC